MTLLRIALPLVILLFLAPDFAHNVILVVLALFSDLIELVILFLSVVQLYVDKLIDVSI